MISLIKCETGFRGKVKSESESCSVLSDSLQPQGLNSPWNSPGQNTRVGSCSFLQGIFPTQGLNPGLPHCSWILYQLSHQGGPSFFFFFFLKPWCPVFFPQCQYPDLHMWGKSPLLLSIFLWVRNAWLWPLFTWAILSVGFATSRIEELSFPETKSRVAYCLLQNS